MHLHRYAARDFLKSGSHFDYKKTRAKLASQVERTSLQECCIKDNSIINHAGSIKRMWLIGINCPSPWSNSSLGSLLPQLVPAQRWPQCAWSQDHGARPLRSIPGKSIWFSGVVSRWRRPASSGHAWSPFLWTPSHWGRSNWTLCPL